MMTIKSAPMCGEHHVLKEWHPATFEYHEASVSVRVPGVYAWVCPADGEASFTPETVEELITMVRELLASAARKMV